MIRIHLMRAAALAAPAMILSSTIAFAQPENPECIAPAQPGGGFDVTCKLAQAALTEAGVLECKPPAGAV